MKKVLFILCLFSFNYLVISCDRTNNASTTFVENTSSQACSDSKIPNEFIVKWKSGKITTVKDMSQHYFVSDFLDQNIDSIESAEPNYKMNLKPQNLKLNQICKHHNWHHDEINSQIFWNKNNFGKDIIIAVTDSGIDLNNQDMLEKIAFNEGENGFDKNGFDKKSNNIDDDGNGYVDDYYGIDLIDNDNMPNDLYGHGTAVTSVIVASHNNDRSKIKGLAPQAKIIPIRFIDLENGSTETAIKAIDYALKRKANIINASWGGPDCSQILPNYLKTIEKEDVILVAASGNKGRNLDDIAQVSPVYPASSNLKNQITVGSIAHLSKKRASFSNYGASSVELFAPGTNIATIELNDQERCFDGTSFSAPIISGSLALLMKAFPNKNHIQIKKALLDATKFDIDFENLTHGSLNLKSSSLD